MPVGHNRRRYITPLCCRLDPQHAQGGSYACFALRQLLTEKCPNRAKARRHPGFLSGFRKISAHIEMALQVNYQHQRPPLLPSLGGQIPNARPGRTRQHRQVCGEKNVDRDLHDLVSRGRSLFKHLTSSLKPISVYMSSPKRASFFICILLTAQRGAN